MTRKGSAFAGVSVALVTPFRDGELDVDTLRAQVEFQIAGRDHLSVPGGHDG